MLRAAAKNHNDVTVITDPRTSAVLNELKRTARQQRLQADAGYKTFALTAA